MGPNDLRDRLTRHLHTMAVTGQLPSTREPLPLAALADALLPFIRDELRTELDARHDVDTSSGNTGPWRLGRHVPINVYAGDRPICQCHTPEDAARIVTAVNAHTAAPAPLYPDTRFLTLCTLDGRRSGEVTVGESRLPAASVLATIRSFGCAEAQMMWPQLTNDELAVMEQLVTDIDTDAADRGGRENLIVVCGSVSDEGRLADAALYTRTIDQHLVYLPRAETGLTKPEHDREHRAWIDRADEILAVRKPDGSVGESTAAEVEYALSQGKPVRWWPPEPSDA